MKSAAGSAWMTAVAFAAAVSTIAAAQLPMPRYEPSSRIRLSGEAGCLKDEVSSGPACVKKCQADFRLDAEAKPPVCIGTKASAKYEPPVPTWKPSEKRPSSTAKGY